MKHWHLYSRSLRKLQRFLADTQTLLPSAGLTCCSLQQLRRSLHDLQVGSVFELILKSLERAIKLIELNTHCKLMNEIIRISIC